MKRPVKGLILTMLCAGTMMILGGCTPPASKGDFESPDPAAKLYAVTRAGQEHNAARIPQLIEQLGSDDPAVRMYAILALEKITGERLGYVYYDPPNRRTEAIDRWLAAYREGRFDTPPAADGAAARP